MNNYFSLKWISIASIVCLFFSACSEETIVYSEIENPNYTINTLTLPLDQNKIFQIILIITMEFIRIIEFE